MPKKTPKEKDKEKEKEIAEPESADQAQWQALKAEAEFLHKLTKKEETDFNEFQQQREKLNYFWILEKKRLEEIKSSVRSKEREMQELEETQLSEIKVYKDRLKHLIHEQQNELSQRKIGLKIAQKMALDSYLKENNTMKAENHQLTQILNEVMLKHEAHMRTLKQKHDRKITELRHEFEHKADTMQQSYDIKLQVIREELDKKRRQEIKEIEESKELLVKKLILDHQKEFTDIKAYYNDITHNNLDMIKSLKEEVRDLEEEEKKDQTRLYEKMLQNKKISGPLQRLSEENSKLMSQLENYHQEKSRMKEIKEILNTYETKQNAIAWEHETILQKLILLKKERDILKQNLITAMYDIKQKTSFQTLLLEKKKNLLSESIPQGWLPYSREREQEQEQEENDGDGGSVMKEIITTTTTTGNMSYHK